MKNTAPFSTPTSSRSRSGVVARELAAQLRRPGARSASSSTSTSAIRRVRVERCGRNELTARQDTAPDGWKPRVDRSRTASRSAASESRSTPPRRSPSSTSLRVRSRVSRSGRPAARSAASRSTSDCSATRQLGQLLEVELVLDVFAGQVARPARPARPSSSALRAMLTSAPGWTRRSAGITSWRIRLRRSAAVGVGLVDARAGARAARHHSRVSSAVSAQQRPGDLPGCAAASPAQRAGRTSDASR